MQPIKLTIITICLNGAKFLSENFDSVSPHLSEGIEHILIDAGSIDDSRVIIENYSKMFPNVSMIFETDSGPAEGLNKGLIAARGEYIGVLNSDDFYAPGALSLVLRKIHKNRADIIYGYGNVLENGKSTFVHVGRLKLRNFALQQQQIFQPSIFFRSSTIRNLNLFFNHENSTCWDAEFVCNLLKNGAKVERIPYALSTFRIHENSITGMATNEQEYLADMRRVTSIARQGRSLFFDKVGNLVTKSRPYTVLKRIYKFFFNSSRRRFSR